METNCSIRFICSDFKNRIKYDCFTNKAELGYCEFEFNGECTSREAQKEILQKKLSEFQDEK